MVSWATKRRSAYAALESANSSLALRPHTILVDRTGKIIGKGYSLGGESLDIELAKVFETNRISLRIRNLLGQEIQVRHHGELVRGNYTFTWNALPMPSGVYFAQLEAKGITKTQRVVVVR